MKLEDYGLDKETAQRLAVLCQSEDPAIREIVAEACKRSNADISRWLYRHFTEGVSFNEMTKTECVPVMDTDFYGYHRKALSIFGNLYLKRLLPQERSE